MPYNDDISEADTCWILMRRPFLCELTERVIVYHNWICASDNNIHLSVYLLIVHIRHEGRFIRYRWWNPEWYCCSNTWYQLCSVYQKVYRCCPWCSILRSGRKRHHTYSTCKNLCSTIWTGSNNSQSELWHCIFRNYHQIFSWNCQEYQKIILKFCARNPMSYRSMADVEVHSRKKNSQYTMICLKYNW